MEEPNKIERDPPRLITITQNNDGQRIDNFLLSELKGVPKSHIYRLLRKGQFRVNKGRIKPVYRLKIGDIVRIPPMQTRQQQASAAPSESLRRLLEQRIIHEDDAMIILNKPSGIAVHAGSGVDIGVIEAMRSIRPELEDLSLVHRLDRATSGCLLLAKNRKALLSLQQQLDGEGMEKRYQTLLKGHWLNKDEWSVDEPLLRSQLQSGERMVQVSPQGKTAYSCFRIIDYLRNCVLAEVLITTGRTHQIRVHAAFIEHPVAGDEKYGCPEFNLEMRQYGLKRMFLHASSLIIKHPVTGKTLPISADLDDDMKAVLNALGR